MDEGWFALFGRGLSVISVFIYHVQIQMARIDSSGGSRSGLCSFGHIASSLAAIGIIRCLLTELGGLYLLEIFGI